MASHRGIKFIKISGVKSTDVGESDISLVSAYTIARTPECELDFYFCVPKSTPFSCMGGIL